MFKLGVGCLVSKDGLADETASMLGRPSEGIGDWDKALSRRSDRIVYLLSATELLLGLLRIVGRDEREGDRATKALRAA